MYAGLTWPTASVVGPHLYCEPENLNPGDLIMADGSMKVVQKFVDMAKYVYVVLRNFPKSEKYSLAADIRHILWEAGTLLERASVVPSKPDKLRLLQHADMKLSELKFLVRMGMELEFVPFEKYKNFSSMVTEIGRMLGGWLKFVRQ
jgi:four helix bundle protein